VIGIAPVKNTLQFMNRKTEFAGERKAVNSEPRQVGAGGEMKTDKNLNYKQ